MFQPASPLCTSIFIFVVTAISRRRAIPKLQAKPLLSSAKYLAKTTPPSHPTPLPCLQRKPKICKKENPSQLSPRRCQNHAIAPPLKPPPNTRFPSPVRTPKSWTIPETPSPATQPPRSRAPLPCHHASPQCTPPNLPFSSLHCHLTTTSPPSQYFLPFVHSVLLPHDR